MLMSVEGMLLSQHRLHQPQCQAVHLFRLRELDLSAQHQRQVIHAHECRGMLLAQHRLHQRQCLSHGRASHDHPTNSLPNLVKLVSVCRARKGAYNGVRIVGFERRLSWLRLRRKAQVKI